MNETREPETKTDGQAGTHVRKPWHAPRFIMSGLASTDAVSNAGGDGGPIGTSLS
jgi:hypothetical protein